MLFFFKEKPVEIIALVEEGFEHAQEFAPVILAKEFIPKWWKDTPASWFDWVNLSPIPSVKNCPGVFNQITTGLILPMWCDLAMKWNHDNFECKFSDSISLMHNHPNNQAPGFYSDYYICKIQSPWRFKTKVRMMYTSPFYHYTESAPFTIPSGIIEPYNGYLSSNVFCFFKKTKAEQSVMIKHKDPLLQIIPLTEKNYTLKVETLTKEEYNRSDAILGKSTTFIKKNLSRRKVYIK